MRQTPKPTPNHGAQYGAQYGAKYGAQSGGARTAPYPLTLESGGYGASQPPPGAGMPEYGAQYGAPYGTENGAPIIDATFLTWRLEEAGRTLLALPNTGHSTRLRNSSLEIVRNAAEAYGWSEKRLRPPIPSAAAIDRMDRSYAWLQLIPDEKYVLRRLVAARSLVHPLTDRHLYP